MGEFPAGFGITGTTTQSGVGLFQSGIPAPQFTMDYGPYRQVHRAESELHAANHLPVHSSDHEPNRHRFDRDGGSSTGWVIPAFSSFGYGLMFRHGPVLSSLPPAWRLPSVRCSSLG